jgi:hypothetical protein
MEVVDVLRHADVDVEQVHPKDVSRTAGALVDVVLDVAVGEIRARFAVEERQRAPYPNELARLEAVKRRIGGFGAPLLVVPFVSLPLAAMLTASGWSWADTSGNFDLRSDGLVARQRVTTTPPRMRTTGLPQGTGSLGIIRALINFIEGENEEPGATMLAAQANVSQPRASQVLRKLLDLGLVSRSTSGRWTPNRAALVDRFILEYRGPGGSQQYFYSLDSPTDVACRVAAWHAERGRFAVSADVGPDLLVPWRRPSIVVLYATAVLDPAALGLVSAQGPHDANVLLRSPHDTSVFPVPRLVAEVNGVEVPLADVTQQIWDLHDLGGADRLEAAGMLREWLIGRS